MEQILNKLKLPFFIILIIIGIIVLIQLSGMYNSYWQGKLAKLRYENEK